MDATVSARIGIEKRDRAHKMLEEIQSTPTQLINSAYDYFLETGKLPEPETRLIKRPKTLTKDQIKKLEASIAQTTYPVDASFFSEKSDKELLTDALRAKYGMDAR